MTKTVLSAMALVAFAMVGGVPAQADEQAAAPAMTKGEKRLAKLIEGRVAGEPESCINDFGVRSFQVIDKTAIVYKIGRTVWVNYTRDPETLDDSDTLVFRRFGSQICNSDIVTTIDSLGGFYTGNVFLSEFVPYRLPEKEG
jgi:hypothetical protein